jgi:hypothetical protein
MATRMQQRRGTAAQWTTADPILAAGEIGFETDTSQFKIGDGTNHWSDLSYFKNLEDLGGTLDDYVPLTQKDAPNGVAGLDANGYVPVNLLANVIGDAPEILNTLEEVASAMQDANGIVASQISAAITDEIQDRNDAITTAVATEATNRDQAISTAVGDHNNDTTNVHGIADTTALATNTSVGTAVSDHNSDTTNVHGIADTSELATKSGIETLTNKTISAADNTVTVNLADVIDVTASASEVNILDGATLTVTELNYVDGVTSNIQTQIDAKAPLAAPALTGNATAENLIISGNLTVQGTTTTVSATNLEVTDSLIYLSSEQFDTDSVDIGIFGAYGDAQAGHFHTGLIRDASDSGKWKLISAGPEPTSNVVDFASVTYDTLKLGGIEFSDGVQVKQGVPSLTSINQQTGAYTTVLSDRDKLVEVSSASGVTVTIPADSTVAYPVGTSIDILQTGAGQVTIAGAGGVTVNATPGLKLRTQWSSATLFKRATDTWVVFGDLSA